MKHEHTNRKAQGLLRCGALLDHTATFSVKIMDKSWLREWLMGCLCNLYFLAQVISLRLQCVALSFKFRVLLFKNFVLRLQILHLRLEKGYVVTQDDCRAVFTNPFFYVRKWVHIFHGDVWSNDGAKTRLQPTTKNPNR